MTRDIPVPDELFNEIFPEAQLWHQRHQSGHGVESNIAAGGFLKLLLELHAIFVQDSVLLRKTFPSLFIFEHPLFETPAYRAYTQRFDAIYATAEEPSQHRLNAVLPELVQHMDAGFNNVLQVQSGMGADMRAMSTDITRLNRQSTSISKVMIDVLSGHASVTFNASWPSTSVPASSAPHIYPAASESDQSGLTAPLAGPSHTINESDNPLAQLEAICGPLATIHRPLRHLGCRVPSPLWRTYGGSMISA